MQVPDSDAKVPLQPGETTPRSSAAQSELLQVSTDSSSLTPSPSQDQSCEPDSRDVNCKFWFGDDNLVNINISRHPWPSDDMYSSLPETSPIEADGSDSLPEVSPIEAGAAELSFPQAVAVADGLEAPPSYTPFDETQELAAPGTTLNVVMMVVGGEEEVKAFVEVGKWLRARCGHKVRVAAHPAFQRLVQDGGLEFFGLRAEGDEAFLFAGEQRLQAKGSEGLRRWREALPQTLRSCWKSCIQKDGSGKAFIADAIVANPPCLAHVHCAEALGIPMHILSMVPWTPTREFRHPLALIGTSDASSSMANLLSYAIVETMLWQQARSSVNEFRKERLGLEPVDSVFLPASLHGLNIPTTYLNTPYIAKKPADWSGNVFWAGTSDPVGSAARSIHNAVIKAHQPCPLFPQKIATLRSKQSPFPFSGKAARLLVDGKVLAPNRIHPFRPCIYNLTALVRDPVTGILTTTSDTVTALLAGATAGPREAYRQSKLRGDAASGEDLQPYQSVALSTAKGMGRIVTASLMTPVTFTGAVAQGFHNAPRLYGDDTVREPAKVTGWRSGFIEAGKGFGQGVYDGLTGFVTQPVDGARKGGAVGFLKGFGKGTFGLALKPAAGAVGFPAHALNGLYKEVQKVGRTNTDAYIVESRIAASDGEGDNVASLDELDRQDLVLKWAALRKEAGD